MVNTELLNQRIEKSGLKLNFIAEQMGISRVSLWHKLKNERPFKVQEVQDLCDVVGISDPDEKERIFFADTVA